MGESQHSRGDFCGDWGGGRGRRRPGRGRADGSLEPCADSLTHCTGPASIFPPLGPSGGMADATDSKSVGGNPMRVRLSPRASGMLCCVLLAFTQFSSAQTTLRGTVIAAESGEPLGFSIVTLHPGFGQRFTDPRGTFAFDLPHSGSYV